jgi:hypothetical protein
MIGLVHSTNSINTRRLMLGFVAGFLAVLVFHQPVLGLLHVIGLTAGTPYSFRPLPPFNVPAVLSASFWGGVWGIVFVLIDRHFPRGSGYWPAAFLFGAIFPTLVAWFIVLPLKGAPLGGGFDASRVVTGLLVNGAWGLGTAIILTLLNSRLQGDGVRYRGG